MPIILNIDTAIDTGSVCISSDSNVIAERSNNKQHDHASWIHTAIREVAKEADIAITDLDAVAVSNGPGSYTGLRIGLATAKGLCFSLDIPLILLSTLKVMAAAVIMQKRAEINEPVTLLCPMIDARRMESYFAVYDQGLNEQITPSAIIPDPDFLSELLEKGKLAFFGNGCMKYRDLITHENAFFFTDFKYGAGGMALLADNSFRKKEFADKAYSEPFYIKDFYTPGRK